MTIRDAAHQARTRLTGVGIAPAEAALDADLLARHVLGWDRATLVARSIEEAPAGFSGAYSAAIERRERREPVAYIVGHQEFWGRDFVVGPGVLIPRPETELVVEEALAWARLQPGPLRIVDVGTGSGCLAITLALELPDADLHATDVSPEALAIARQNATRLGAAVRFHHGSALAGSPLPVDLVVSNPPYIAGADYEGLQPEVRLYEPAIALLGGDEGLDVVSQVVEAAVAGLGPEGRLLMEIGLGQADAVKALVARAPLHLVAIRPDLQGIPRAVVAARGPVAPSAIASE